jgi:hypothetical protein
MIGTSNDPLELEADRIAEQVLATTAHPVVSGAAPRIQRFAGITTGQAETAPASVDRVLASSGSPLETTLQHDMGQRFGHDFSRVRIHSDAAADRSAQDVCAHAYTVGHHIAFGSGRFAPLGYEGLRLLAHELTHVVQQSGAPPANGSPPGNGVQHLPAALPNVSTHVRLEARSPIRVARQQSDGKPVAELTGEPAEDRWKGTPVSEIIISLARKRVGFRVPQGMLLGTVKTDLAVGTYELKPIRAAHV